MLGQCPGPCLLFSTSPGLTLIPSRQLRCRKPRSCSSAPPCSFTFPAGHQPGKVPTNTARLPQLPRGLQPCGLQRMHITFTCLCCNLLCSPAWAGVTWCLRAAWLMSGATVTPKPQLSHLSPLPLASKVSVPPVFVKRENEEQLCWVTKLSEGLQTAPHFSCCLL